MSRSAQLYTPHGIAIGTLLGTLAGGAVLLFLNYRALGYDALARKVVVGGLVGYVLIILVASAALPDHPALTLLLAALQAGVAYWAAWILQGDAIAYHRAQGGGVHSSLRAAGVGLLAGLVAVPLLLLITLALGIGPDIATVD